MAMSLLQERPMSSGADPGRQRAVGQAHHGWVPERGGGAATPIVAAVDGSARTPATARIAARMACWVGAPLIFVYVRSGPPGWLGRPYYQRRLDSEMTAAQNALDKAVAVARREGVAAEAQILEGKSARRIREFAASREARFVVVGSRRRRIKLSVSRNVIRQAGRPVMVVGAQGGM